MNKRLTPKDFYAVDSMTRWERHNRILLKERIEACQLWRTAPVITQADIDLENVRAKKRLLIWWGIDLDAELAQGLLKATPRKDDLVEHQGRVGHVQRIMYLDGERTVSVLFGTEVELFDYDQFTEYASPWGRTHWYV